MTTAPIPWWRSWRALIGAGLLLAQLVMIVLTHVSSTCCASRYFAWAPNDYSVDYTIAATVNGRTLAADEIQARYRVRAKGFWEDPPQRLERYLRRRDQVYSPGQRVQLTVRYRLDGRGPLTWSWSQR